MTDKQRSLSVTAVIIAIFLNFPVVYAATDDNYLQIGETVYNRYCLACHGKGGKGDGPNSDSLNPVPRDLTDSGAEKQMAKKTTQELFDSIELGGRGVEKSPLMPAWGKTLSEYEIWAVISYIDALSQTKNRNIDFGKKMNRERPQVKVKDITVPEPAGRGGMRGKRAYVKYGCSGCHQLRGRGGVSGPDLTGILNRLKPEKIYGVIQNADTASNNSRMPVYDLSEETAVLITHYLMTVD